MQLYVPERHFELKKIAWSEERARNEATKMIQEIAAAFNESTYWKPHPLDDETGTAETMTTVYFGSPGVAWALAEWQRRTGEKLALDCAGILERWVREKSTREEASSLFFGALGDRLALESVRPEKANREAMGRIISEGLAVPVADSSGEVMAGVPGGLVASTLIYERLPLGEDPGPWRELIRQHVERLFETWKFHEGVGAYLWQQNYGRLVHYVGAAHGSVGNVFALLRASEHLTEREKSLTLERTEQLLDRLAMRGEDGINWPSMIEITRDSLLHWCHGSPGIVSLLATRLPKSPVFDELMAKGGELTWKAGALKKGASLCHGTAGSGATCLKLYERTGEPKWLDRARAFAMNAIEQLREDQQKYGLLRHSLWTGDPGVALYLLDCVDGRHEAPFMDEI